MKVNKIILRDFQLFKEQTIILDRINLITGINFDSLEEDGSFSGNGSAKTTIINAILFGRFGEVTDINLKDLIRIGTKETKVILEITKDNDTYRIIRKIPTSLQIFKHNEEVKFNTTTLAQKFLDELFGSDFKHYRTYNIIDQKKGINLLNLGTISLRKSLMEFCANTFSKIRTSLLSKKLDRETYNVNKRLYTFYLSQKKLTTLEKGLEKIKLQEDDNLHDLQEQSKIINNYKSDISSREKIIYFKRKDIEKAAEGICPILKSKCDRIGSKLTERDKGRLEANIDILNQEINYFYM